MTQSSALFVPTTPLGGGYVLLAWAPPTSRSRDLLIGHRSHGFAVPSKTPLRPFFDRQPAINSDYCLWNGSSLPFFLNSLLLLPFSASNYWRRCQLLNEMEPIRLKYATLTAPIMLIRVPLWRLIILNGKEVFIGCDVCWSTPIGRRVAMAAQRYCPATDHLVFS